MNSTRSTPMALLAACAVLWGGTAYAADATKQEAGTPRPAVVIYDDARVYAAPSIDAERIHTANCGDIVTLLGERKERSLRVKVDKTTGWAYESSVVRLHQPGASARLLVAAMEAEDPPHPLHPPRLLNALALYSRWRELVPTPQYEAFVLYRYGRLADRLAALLTRQAEQELPPEARATGAGRLGWKGLDEYKKWGLNFQGTYWGDYEYGGETYKKILKDYPKSQWADNAAFWVLQHSGMIEWERSPAGPLEELPRWQEFVNKYPDSELKPEARLEIGYIYRVLYEMYSLNKDIANPAKAAKYRHLAIGIYDDTRRKFRGTEFAARAERNVAELRDGTTVYFVSERIGPN